MREIEKPITDAELRKIYRGAITDDQIKEIEKLLNEKFKGQIKNKTLHYKPCFVMEEPDSIMQYYFYDYGICAADIVFDENGTLHVDPLFCSPDISQDNYPRLNINKINDQKPIEFGNVKSVEVPVFKIWGSDFPQYIE